MPKLFTAYTLRGVTLRNRLAVPPMCQYSAVDGVTTDWHLHRYSGHARGGAGPVIVEATAVSPEGRITPGCTCLWNDAQVPGMAAIPAVIRAGGAVPGIQIGHAGRKASANRPWQGDDHIADADPRGVGDDLAVRHPVWRQPAQGAARDDDRRHRAGARWRRCARSGPTICR